MNIELSEKAKCVRTRLLEYSKENITRQELAVFGSCQSEQSLFELVTELEGAGIIKAHKTKNRTNGNHLYPVHDKYHILVKESYDDEKAEMLGLHPLLLRHGYLQKNPKKYRENRQMLQTVSAYLYKAYGNTSDEYAVFVSRRSRSFQIFGNEKMLDRESGNNTRAFLDSLGITKDVLKFYDTAINAFYEYIPRSDRDSLTLLISENEDFFYDVRTLMYKDEIRSLFGVQIDGIVFGEGGRIRARNALTSAHEYLDAGEIKYLYLGDIDRAGFRLYQDLCRLNPEINISLFKEGYLKMIELSVDVELAEDTDDHRSFSNTFGTEISVFPDRHRSTVEKCIELNKRIPQEILNMVVLRKAVK